MNERVGALTLVDDFFPPTSLDPIPLPIHTVVMTVGGGSGIRTTGVNFPTVSSRQFNVSLNEGRCEDYKRRLPEIAAEDLFYKFGYIRKRVLTDCVRYWYKIPRHRQ
jgi:hypothetical protein